MKRNLVGKILCKIKIFVQDFIPIRTALSCLELSRFQIGQRRSSSAFSFRCLDHKYLVLKIFLLQRFLHNVVVESVSPNTVRAFLGVL